MIAISQIESERGYLAAIGKVAAQGVAIDEALPRAQPVGFASPVELRQKYLEIRSLMENGRAVEEVLFHGTVIHRVYV